MHLIRFHIGNARAFQRVSIWSVGQAACRL